MVKYHVVDAFDGDRGESVESTHRSREAAETRAARMNRDLSGAKYRVIAAGRTCPTCDGSGQHEGRDCYACDGQGKV